jgi:hypothetical protein
LPFAPVRDPFVPAYVYTPRGPLPLRPAGTQP